MAHRQQRDFCLMVRARFPEHFVGVWALDIGSLNINGSNRSLFEGSGYIGVDLGTGNNVDFAVPAHKLNLPDCSFDTIASTECFEHDPHYAETLQNATRLLKPGGLFFFTCATEGRPEHGTRRTTPNDAPLLMNLEEWGDYYKTLTAQDVMNCIDVNSIFSGYEFSTNDETHDLYFWGIKRGAFARSTTYSFLEEAAELRKQRDEIGALQAQLEEGAPGVLALRGRLASAEKRVEDLSAFARESVKEQRTWQARAEELEHLVENLRGQISWFENTRSWKVTKPLRLATRMKREGLLPPLRHYLAKRLGRQIPPPTPAAPQEPPKPIPPVSPSKLAFDYPFIRIMTTKHTHFVAQLLEDAIRRWGYRVSIDFEYIQDRPCGYVVICPQMYAALPEQFIAFQMEQSVHQRWFTSAYIDTLKSAEAVFDYATENIEFLLGKGVPRWSLFYVPITPKASSDAGPARQQEGADSGSSPKFDFVFYGDPSSPRRQEMLRALGEHFKVLILSEVFGEELDVRLRSGRAIVNIHYYEDALLETTRLSEAISKGFVVLSEGVANAETLDQFESDRVSFFRMGDTADMIEKARALLRRLENSAGTREASELAWHGPRFADYVDRYLLYRGHVPISSLGPNFYPETARHEPYPRLCLSLPETAARKRAFAQQNKHGFRIVHGARGGPGWVGCALSYKYIAREALTTSARYVTICEDDVEFGPDFQSKFATIERWLRANSHAWDIFSGLIADLHADAVVTDVTTAGDLTLVTIAKMTSMVFNVYSPRALQLISRWNEHERDARTNTIDRYLEQSADLRVVVALPYLVGHSEELASTLWDFQNTEYSAMIAKSEALLRQKVEEFLRRAAVA